MAAARFSNRARRAGADSIWFVLDVGGEGRHPEAWNLNPRTRCTLGGDRAIPRLICARGEAIPLADDSVDVVIVERTPLRAATLAEIARVAKRSATFILRHAVTPAGDPHRLALKVFTGTVTRRMTTIDRQQVAETIVRGQSRTTLSRDALPLPPPARPQSNPVMQVIPRPRGRL